MLITTAVLLLAAGCSPPPIQAETSLTIEITEKGFIPGDVFVPIGREITVTIINKTGSDHAWTVLAEPYFSPYQTDAPDVFYEILVPAGKSMKDTFTAPATGIQLDIICENELCIEAGFRGRFIAIEE